VQLARHNQEKLAEFINAMRIAPEVLEMLCHDGQKPTTQIAASYVVTIARL